MATGTYIFYFDCVFLCYVTGNFKNHHYNTFLGMTLSGIFTAISKLYKFLLKMTFLHSDKMQFKDICD